MDGHALPASWTTCAARLVAHVGPDQTSHAAGTIFAVKPTARPGCKRKPGRELRRRDSGAGGGSRKNLRKFIDIGYVSIVNCGMTGGSVQVICAGDWKEGCDVGPAVQQQRRLLPCTARSEEKSTRFPQTPVLCDFGNLRNDENLNLPKFFPIQVSTSVQMLETIRNLLPANRLRPLFNEFRGTCVETCSRRGLSDEQASRVSQARTKCRKKLQSTAIASADPRGMDMVTPVAEEGIPAPRGSSLAAALIR